MSLGKIDFFRLMSEEEKSFFLTLFFSTPFSIGKKVLCFFWGVGKGISWLTKEKKINCFCHMFSSANYFPSNYNCLLLAILHNLPEGSLLVVCLLWAWTSVWHVSQCYNITQSSFTALRILWARSLPASLPAQTPGNHWSFYCLRRFAFSLTPF